jgi:formylmethanofuran dehydrogenase subunit E
MTLLREAEDFHGHLGPFLVIGVRAGLIGLIRLGITRGDPKLSVTAMLKNSTLLACSRLSSGRNWMYDRKKAIET